MEFGYPYLKDLVLIFSAYVLGSVSIAYYLVRIKTGQDIRDLGTGTAGGANVGRVLGAPGFLMTFTGDLAKGALAVAAALYAELGTWSVLSVMIAVVVGQIWPAHLGFHGGKGFATATGAAIVFDYWIVIAAVVIASVTLVALRRRMLSGMLALALAPGVAALLGHTQRAVLGLSALALIVLFAHRENISSIIWPDRLQAGKRC